jgi:hypothetical protein
MRSLSHRIFFAATGAHLATKNETGGRLKQSPVTHFRDLFQVQMYWSSERFLQKLWFPVMPISD